MKFDGKAFGAEIVAAVKAHLAAELAPMLSRLDALETRTPAISADDLKAIRSEVASLRKSVEGLPDMAAPELPDIAAMVAGAVAAVPAPKDGKDADPVVIRRMVDDAVSALPKARDGKDIDPDHVSAQLGELVTAALSTWEKPRDGKSVTIDDVRPLIDEAIQKSVAAIPLPKDGCGIRDLLIDRHGALVATMEDGRTRNLGRVVGRDGVDADMDAVERSIAERVAAIPAPKDGEDGFSLTDFDAALKDDGRTVVLSFERADVKRSVELAIPAMIYRGVYKQGRRHVRGDVVTWGGSLWHCDAVETVEKPDGAEKHWTLAAKRGRDGKDGTVKADTRREPLRLGSPERAD